MFIDGKETKGIGDERKITGHSSKVVQLNGTNNRQEEKIEQINKKKKKKKDENNDLKRRKSLTNEFD